MYEKYKGHVEFFLVYIKEAHALDSPRPSIFKEIEDPITLEERNQVCTQCLDDLDIPIPAIVDKIDNRVNLAYSGHPDRLYLVGKDGKITYAGGRGPRGFDPEELEDWIVLELLGAPKQK